MNPQAHLLSSADIRHEVAENLEAFRSKISQDIRSELEDVKSRLMDVQSKLANFRSDASPSSPGFVDVQSKLANVCSDTSPSTHTTSFQVPGNVAEPSWQAGDLSRDSPDMESSERHENYTPLLETSDDDAYFAPRRTSLYGQTVGFTRRKSVWFSRRQALRTVNDITEDSCRGLVQSYRFEYLCGFLVLINAIFIGIEAHIQCSYDLHQPRMVTIGLEAAEIMFMIFFSIEWSLRLAVHKCQFYRMEGWHWNVFDTFVLGSQIAEQLLSFFRMLSKESQDDTSVSIVGVLRMLRLLRIIRMVRLLHLFSDLGVLVSSIMSSLQALLWALILMAAIVYAFSVFFAQRIAQISKGNPSSRLAYYFAGVPRTALTLTECILGGVSWDEPVMRIFEEIGWLSGLLVLSFIVIGLFVLVNIVTGVFIDRTMRSAGAEENRKIAEDLAIAFGLSEDGITQNESLTHHERTLNFAAFKDRLQQPAMQRYFESIDLQVDDHHIRKFFTLLDVDGSGDVTAAELYAGCLRLRGSVRAVDLAIQGYDQHEQLHNQQKHLVKLEELLTHLSQSLRVKPPKRNKKTKGNRMAL